MTFGILEEKKNAPLSIKADSFFLNGVLTKRRIRLLAVGHYLDGNVSILAAQLKNNIYIYIYCIYIYCI